MNSMHKHTNHLSSESSPYLLQHAHNPVDWYPWGKEALERAASEQKMILVSIGYSACHWCHVMERESFEDESTARVMNEHFINIKIDREERPDIDHLYMDAVQAMTGSGGWPLNVFLTPEKKPFYGGTYFPPVKAFNRPSWMELLQGLISLWAEKRNEAQAQAENLLAHLQSSSNILFKKADFIQDEGNTWFTKDNADAMFASIMRTADTEWGGFGKAPKFPQTFTIRFLLQYHHFTDNSEALNQALLSLDKMLCGGIYDQLAGGLARYSTDTEWLAPHFEKMLYDNALLTDVLCDAWLVTGKEEYAAAIKRTISFVRQELLNKQGGFYAALDADSEDEEGKYYVWQKEEIEKILGNEAELFCDFFNVSAAGNWEGKNILRILQPLPDFATQKGYDADALHVQLSAAIEKLKAARAQRIAPGLDDKSILSWNAMMLQAVAKAATVLPNSGYENMANGNFNFILKNLSADTPGAALMHTWKNGQAKFPAFLDDYACLIAACIQLYETAFDESCLHNAHKYCTYVIDNFSDEDKIFFYYTNTAQTDVIIRKKEIYDGATPSGNSVMASNLLKLSIIFNEPNWRSRAEQMMKAICPLVIKYPGSFGNWACLLLQQLSGINEIAVVGKKYLEMAGEILRTYIPEKVMMAAEYQRKEFALLNKKESSENALIYLCKNYTCTLPYTDINDFKNYIEQKNKISNVAAQ